MTNSAEGNVYFVGKEMFISAEITSAIIQLQLASPAINTWRRLNPNRNGVKPYRDAGVGLQLRGHTCGPDAVRSEMGFDVKVECFPSKSNLASAEVQTKNKHLAWSPRSV